MNTTRETPIIASTLSRGTQTWFVYLVSAVLFLTHKMESRTPGSPTNPDLYPDWHREMPGLLVSHEPFDTLINMGITLCMQAALAGVCLWLLYRAFRELDRRPRALGARLVLYALSFFWVGFGYFETHHILKLVGGHVYVPGCIFATLFVLWMFLVLVPALLHHQIATSSGSGVVRTHPRPRSRSAALPRGYPERSPLAVAVRRPRRRIPIRPAATTTVSVQGNAGGYEADHPV